MHDLKERLENILALHDDDTVGCTECCAKIDVRLLRSMAVSDDVDLLLSEDDHELVHYRASHSEHRWELAQGLHKDMEGSRREQILNDFDISAQATDKHIDAARAEARIGLLVFDDTYDHSIWCPECGEGRLELATERCAFCDEMRCQLDMDQVELFESPFDDEPIPDTWVCTVGDANGHGQSCAELLNDSSYTDFHYEECVVCGRTITVRNPDNGWMSFFRNLTDEYGEWIGQICLRCYEEDLLENGLSDVSLESGEISGMFFSGDNHELYDAGFECVHDYEFVNSPKKAQELCAEGVELKKQCYVVVFGFERMAIGNSEGTVSMWKKLKNVDKEFAHD